MLQWQHPSESNAKTREYCIAKPDPKTRQEKIDGQKQVPEYPRTQRQLTVQPLDDHEKLAENRAEAMKKAYSTGAYTLKAIADHFGVHYSTVSRVVNR
ncbi:MAG: hypothetical protein Tsb002_28050 [Wenzhouxiangellaceae bacterium]